MPLHVLPTQCIAPDPSRPFGGRAGAITRRSFLAGLVAGCVRPDALRPMPSPRREPIWALVSDTHIDADSRLVVRGSNMTANLRRVVVDVLAAAPDAAVVNGDIAKAVGDDVDYSAFNGLFVPILDARIPAHFVVGNHDQRDNFCRSLTREGVSPLDHKCVSRFIADGRHFVFLDSLEKTNAIRGSLGRRQLDWLAENLDARPDLPAIVFVHHNPEPSLVGLKDTAAFLKVVTPRRQVKAVVFGHTHEYRTWTHRGLHFINLPATGYRFAPETPLGWVLARFAPAGVELEFRAVTPDTPLHGDRRFLTWRPAASA